MLVLPLTLALGSGQIAVSDSPIPRDPPVTAQVSEEDAKASPDSSGARKPAPLNASVWFSHYDVPARNLNNPAIRPVRFRLDVGPAGRVIGCAILDSNGFEDVDEGICRAASERARFAPARNGQGQPIEGYYVGKISWNRNQDPVTATFTAVYEFTLHIDGTTSDCEVVGLFGPVPPTLMNSNPCTRPRTFAPVRDEDGKPVERRIRSVYSMEVIEPAEGY
ncbi:energy transducer TonB [Qipengyuania oceanensis]|uniref:TonB C-terminal domain-containing protein n=1 Tax=Qipengyuania oceanensis TaxID=1463597 RepID=A0A844YD44_9SPHN|nr:energy transducer TonB [Qipengyuania oceanensis]MXO61503.1 hypothetical protein [Qipengyuania oceanensis]